MDLLADTTFLIDLWREQRQEGLATGFARRHANLAVGLPWVVAGEFLSGGAAAGYDPEVLSAFLEPYPVVHSTDAIVRQYAQMYGAVRRDRLSVGPNDLWIAACAAALALPVVTRNVRDFVAIPGIKLLGYDDGA